MSFINLKNISKDYQFGKNSVPVLKGINLTIENGEYVAVMGPSGAGKSTLMHIIGLLTSPSDGNYHLDGQMVTGLKPNQTAKIRGSKIGFIFQDFQLIEWGNCLYNVLIPLMQVKMPQKKREQIGRKWLTRLDLGHRLFHRPQELSGGERQRVAIARAMVMEPPIILADEATGNLDQKRGEEILDIFDEINTRGCVVIHVTHSRKIAQRADRIIEMVDGRLSL